MTTSQIVMAIRNGTFDNLELLAIEFAVECKRDELTSGHLLDARVTGVLPSVAP